jgi:hypothetical protein
MLCRICALHEPDKMLVNDGTFAYRPVRVGKSFLICGKKDSMFPFHCFVGPDWTCMIMTYILIIVPTVLFINNVAIHWGAAVISVSFILMVAAVCFFSAAACSDPGVVFSDPDPEIEVDEEEAIESEDSAITSDVENGLHGSNADSAIVEPISTTNTAFSRNRNTVRSSTVRMTECGICQIERPHTASHCYDCGVCVNELDHHCPWTGKCIGKKNISQFHYFLWALGVLLAFVVVMVVASVIRGFSIFQFKYHF